MAKYLKQHQKWSDKDYWPTIDPRAVECLMPFVYGKTYAEPCWGAGHLEGLLESYGFAECKFRSDIEPQTDGAIEKDALELTEDDLEGCDLIITNPPFQWSMLKPLLDHLPTLRPTWLLLPADKMHTKQLSPYIDRCEYVVSVGRLKFFFDNDERLWDKETQKFKKNSDPTINYAWFCFDAKYSGFTKFYGR